MSLDHKGVRVASLALVLMLVVVLTGCAARRCPICADARPPEASSGRGGPIPAPTYYCGDDLAGADVAAIERTVRNDPSVDLLLLSGGGSRGSFGAGLLYGWRNSPQFDLVTGISTGAVFATWAYLGRDDPTRPYERMLHSYGGALGNRDIRRRRWLFPFADSIYSLEPLRETLWQVLPTEMVAEAGRIYESTGRQLWIGTTNVETGQFCSWNMGMRASRVRAALDGGDRALADRLTRDYHNLILASCAQPGVFAPVRLTRDGRIPGQGESYYYHVDGGVTKTMYIEHLGAIARAVKEVKRSGGRAELTVYAIANNSLVSDQSCLKPGALPLAARSINLLVKSALRASLDTISVTVDSELGVSRASGGWRMRVASIDYRLRLNPEEEFDPGGGKGRVGMKALFDHGLEWAADNDGDGRWCEGIPAPGNDGPYCDLPVVGIVSCD